jgi:hypothetical protein
MGAEIQNKLVDPDDGWQGKLPRALKRKDRVGGSAVNNYELNREKKKNWVFKSHSHWIFLVCGCKGL